MPGSRERHHTAQAGVCWQPKSWSRLLARETVRRASREASLSETPLSSWGTGFSKTGCCPHLPLRAPTPWGPPPPEGHPAALPQMGSVGSQRPCFPLLWMPGGRPASRETALTDTTRGAWEDQRAGGGNPRVPLPCLLRPGGRACSRTGFKDLRRWSSSVTHPDSAPQLFRESSAGPKAKPDCERVEWETGKRMATFPFQTCFLWKDRRKGWAEAVCKAGRNEGHWGQLSWWAADATGPAGARSPGPGGGHCPGNRDLGKACRAVQWETWATIPAATESEERGGHAARVEGLSWPPTSLP